MVYLILHNIRSVYNVGSIFRTANAAGVSKIYLTGYTPAPVDRFGREVARFTKVSLGAEKTVAWEKAADVRRIIKRLKRENFEIVAVEQDEEAIDYRKYKRGAKTKTALVFGAEVEGIPKNILKLCDKVIEIPLCGSKESLNVSVAVGVALFNATK